MKWFHPSKRAIAYSTIALLLTPLHFLALYHSSLTYLLRGYIIFVASLLNGLAVGLLIGGILLPPVSLAYWVWETCEEA